MPEDSLLTQEQFNALSQCVDVASGDDPDPDVIKINDLARQALAEILRKCPRIRDDIGTVAGGHRS